MHKETFNSLNGATTCGSDAFCEGMEKELNTFVLSAPLQHPETLSRTLITSNATRSETGMEHVPTIRELTEGDDSFTRRYGAASSNITHNSALQSYCGLGSHHACCQAATSDFPTATLGEIARIAQPEVGMRAGNVWLAPAHARRDLMLKVQTLEHSGKHRTEPKMERVDALGPIGPCFGHAAFVAYKPQGQHDKGSIITTIHVKRRV
jgi:hypothetical protein